MVSVVGIALMTVLAYYRSWSKDADKTPCEGFRKHSAGTAAGRPAQRLRTTLRVVWSGMWLEFDVTRSSNKKISLQAARSIPGQARRP